MAVTNVAELNALVERVKKAQREYASFTQEQVDKIFRAAALAAADARIPLAKMAVAESGMGIVEDKVIKNHFASEYIYNAYKDEKTCGVLSEDDTFGTITIAEPIGIICGIVPTTNPTSTAIFKSLISLKTRNAIIFSPHPRAKDATNKAADIVLQAAIAAGAPKDLIGWIDQPSVELSNALMHHPDINLILATGGPGMVKAAYSSGKPAIGVGAGNTPVVIDETADIKRAVASVLMSKTFDNGVICASEQSVVVVDSVAALVPKAEIEGSMEDQQMGLQARLMSKALRKLTGVIGKTNTTVIFINQLRMKIGVMYGNPETTTGGNALKYYASVRMEIKRTEGVKGEDGDVGNHVRVRVVKNKVAPPFRTAEFDIIFGKGICKVGNILDVAVNLDIVKKAGSWFSFNEEKLGQGRDKARDFLTENPDILAQVETLVREKLEKQ